MNTSLLSSDDAGYNHLKSLLVDQKWGEADEETYRLMQQILDPNYQKSLPISNDDMKIFPDRNLRILNNLWLESSGSRFGFTVQSKIWFTLPKPRIIQDKLPEQFKHIDYEYIRLRERFAAEVGWKQKGKSVPFRPGRKLGDRSLASIPRGYYPCKLLVHRSWSCQFIHWDVYFEKLESCFNS